jgi:hypothetical protein
MTTEPTTTPTPRRRWLQYSLRTLMVLQRTITPCGGKQKSLAYYTTSRWMPWEINERRGVYRSFSLKGRSGPSNAGSGSQVGFRTMKQSARSESGPC